MTAVATPEKVNGPFVQTVRGSFQPEVRVVIEQELTAVCEGPVFRSSVRNCAFLRYVVSATLDGRREELKERTLGVELFGRSVDYDTGSDAVVRGRANEVRKKLVRHYDQCPAVTDWQIDLPSGSYVPRFVPKNRAQEMQQTPIAPVAPSTSAPTPYIPVRLRNLMVPTLIALFLCAISLRWQMSSGSPYLDFWNTLLQGRPSITVILDSDRANPGAVQINDLHTIEPLLSLADSFHVPAQVQSSANIEHETSNSVRIYITHANPNQNISAGNNTAIQPHVARIDVVPGLTPVIWIHGGDTNALVLAVHALTDRDEFPQTIASALRRSTTSRIRLETDKPLSAASIADPEFMHR